MKICIDILMVLGLLLLMPFEMFGDAAHEWIGTVHMFCAYWGFVFMSLHLGIHWRVFVGRMGKLLKSILQSVHGR